MADTKHAFFMYKIQRLPTIREMNKKALICCVILSRLFEMCSRNYLTSR